VQSAPTVSKWKSRFEEHDIEGCAGAAPGEQAATGNAGRAGTRNPARARSRPTAARTDRAARLSENLGISKSTIRRILAQAKLQPHRLDRHMSSNDPEFESNAADIIGTEAEFVFCFSLEPVLCHEFVAMRAARAAIVVAGGDFLLRAGWSLMGTSPSATFVYYNPVAGNA
jgi:hypothetical protein